MRKHLLIAAAAAALLLPVLSSGAYAEPPKQEAGAQWKFSDEDRAALVDANIAGLKAGLKLTARAGKELAGGGDRYSRTRQGARRALGRMGREGARNMRTATT